MRTQRLNRLAAIAMVVSIGLSGAGVSAANATASSSNDVKDTSCVTDDVRALCANPESLLNVRVGDVHPTQPTLGYDEVYYKLGRYSTELSKDSTNKKFDDWCEANGQEEAAMTSSASTLTDAASFSCTVAVGAETAATIEPMKTVVIGPGGTLYLTDGHHTLTSFAEDSGPEVHVRLRVLGNLSGLSESDFWDTMQQNKWVWLRDVDGNAIAPSALPANVGLSNFQDDRFRSIMYFARDIGYSADGGVPFQEFYWGTWLRAQASLDVASWNQDDWQASLDLVRQITEAQVALPQDAVVDAESGYTAADLSAFTAWNNGKKVDKGEWAKLSVPYAEGKPGKLAYMTAYRATLPQTPAEELLPAPVIQTPTDGAELVGDTVEFTGTATPDTQLTLEVTDSAAATQPVDQSQLRGAVAATATAILVDEAGSWSATVSLAPGAWSVTAALVADVPEGDVISEPSAAVTFTLDAAATADPGARADADGAGTADPGTSDPGTQDPETPDSGTAGTAGADANAAPTATPGVKSNTQALATTGQGDGQGALAASALLLVAGAAVLVARRSRARNL